MFSAATGEVSYDLCSPPPGGNLSLSDVTTCFLLGFVYRALKPSLLLLANDPLDDFPHFVPIRVGTGEAGKATCVCVCVYSHPSTVHMHTVVVLASVQQACSQWEHMARNRFIHRLINLSAAHLAIKRFFGLLNSLRIWCFNKQASHWFLHVYLLHWYAALLTNEATYMRASPGTSSPKLYKSIGKPIKTPFWDVHFVKNPGERTEYYPSN